MVTYELASKLWGSDSIIRLSEPASERLRLPHSSRRFLREVGIPREPRRAGMWLEVSDDDVPTLGEYALRSQHEEIEDPERHYRIGTNGTLELCIDTQRSGAVVLVDIGSDDAVYVNSSIELFVEFLYLWGFDESPIATDIEADLRQLEEVFEAKDPRAMIDEENWWPMVLHDARIG